MAEDEESRTRELRFSDLRVAQPRLIDSAVQDKELQIEPGYLVEHPLTEEPVVQKQISAIIQILSSISNSPIVHESRMALNKAKRGKRNELNPVQLAMQELNRKEKKMQPPPLSSTAEQIASLY